MKKRKFNLLDGIIIAAVLAVLAGGVLFYLNRGDNQSPVAPTKKEMIEFDILAENLSESEAQSIKSGEGTSITLGKANTDSGRIKSVRIEPYKKIAKDTINGSFVWSIQPAMYQAVITVEKEVAVTDIAFKGEKEEIRIGASMPFLGKGFGISNCYVVDLREVAK